MVSDEVENTYQEGARQVDEHRRGVLPTLPRLRQPVRPETERRTASGHVSYDIISETAGGSNIVIQSTTNTKWKLYYSVGRTLQLKVL